MLGSGVYLAEHFGDAPVLCIFCFHPDGLAVTDSDLPRVSVVGGGSIYPAVQNNCAGASRLSSVLLQSSKTVIELRIALYSKPKLILATFIIQLPQPVPAPESM